MTVPMYFLLLAAICMTVRAMFGLANLTDRHRQRHRLDDLWDEIEDELRRTRRYNRENDAA